jgi:prolyl-tRNA synthetase
LQLFIEANHDEKGIIWNKAISPFDAILLNISPKEDEVSAQCEEIFASLKSDILYDDTQEQTGAKFSRADLLGISTQIIVSKKTLEANCVEVCNRSTGEKTLVSINDLLKDGI